MDFQIVSPLLTLIFNSQPATDNASILHHWNKLPRLDTSKFEMNQKMPEDGFVDVVTLNNVAYQWGDTYNYQGQIDKTTGKPHGIGRRIWNIKRNHALSSIEEGQFEQGQPHGYLREIFANGSYYQGKWSNGWRHGHGLECNSMGQTREGVWTDHEYNYSII